MKKLLLAAVAMVICQTAAQANSLTFTGSSGNLSASATFNLTGSNLSITLTNTASTPTTQQAGVLMGLLFNAPALTASTTSAAFASGSGALNSTGKSGDDPIANPNNWWGYQSPVGPILGFNSAIDASGSAGFGTPFLLNKSQNPAKGALDGSSGGIVALGTTADNDKSYVMNSMVFTFTAPSGFSLDALGSHVQFIYGTQIGGSGGEPNFPGVTPNVVPEPASVLSICIGVAMVGGGFSLRRRKAQACTP